MGRPLSKRVLKPGVGNQIAVRAKIGSASEDFGFIIRQRTANSFEVNVAGNIGVCTLVNKLFGLAAGEMMIPVADDEGNTQIVSKISAHMVTTFSGARLPWTFDTSGVDGRLAASVLIDGSSTMVGPQNQTVTAGAPAVFTAKVASYAASELEPTWQISTDGLQTWTNITTGVFSAIAFEGLTVINTSLTINPTTEDMDGNVYRLLMVGPAGQNSAGFATLTVEPEA